LSAEPVATRLPTGFHAIVRKLDEWYARLAQWKAHSIIKNCIPVMASTPSGRGVGVIIRLTLEVLEIAREFIPAPKPGWTW